MNLEQVEQYDCPFSILNKLKKWDMQYIRTPHDLNNISWEQMEKDIDVIIEAFSKNGTDEDIKDDSVKSRFDIVDW